MALPPRAGRKKPPSHKGAKMEDSSFRQVWRLNNVLFRARKAGTLRDVKNEGTTGDVYENKGAVTKCLAKIKASYTKMH
jgi:hypothetical protein